MRACEGVARIVKSNSKDYRKAIWLYRARRAVPWMQEIGRTESEYGKTGLNIANASEGRVRRQRIHPELPGEDLLYDPIYDAGTRPKPGNFYEWNRSQALAHKPMNSSFFLRWVSGVSRPSPKGPVRCCWRPSGGVPMSRSYSSLGRLRELPLRCKSEVGR